MGATCKLYPVLMASKSKKANIILKLPKFNKGMNERKQDKIKSRSDKGNAAG